MNQLPPTNEVTRVTLRRIPLAPFVKWLTLAFAVLGSVWGIMCTAWYAIAGQLTRGASVWYFFVTAILYAAPGLVGSIIFGVIYNSVAPRIGGFQFDIVEAERSHPPTPPEPWEGTLPKINAPDTPDRA